jgi:hypothetical protein
MARLVPTATAAALAGIGALHLLWATGSSFPFPDRAALADSVVGTHEVPSSGACVTVATALLSGAALVAGPPKMPPGLRRAGLIGLTAVLAGRGGLGLAGRTDLVSPGSSSTTFRRLDRRVFSPLCLALAAGSATALAPASPAPR